MYTVTRSRIAITLAGMRFHVRVGVLPHERELAQPLEFLETIGGDIASRCLALPEVASVRVAVRKPHVALGGPLAHAEVVVEQDRE